MPEHSSLSREYAQRVGSHIKRGFLNYVDHWQEWIVPTILAGAIAAISLFCCVLPYVFVLGPVACGLYACALAALRNRPVDARLLKRGWERLGSSIAASVFITIGRTLPALLLLALFFGFGMVMVLIDSSQRDRHQQPPNQAETATERATPSEETLGSENGDGESVARTHGQEGPSFFLEMLAVFVFYALFLLGFILMWIWQLWFATRTMFVYPLIVDRGLGFVESLRRSWAETRVRFWELLLVNLASQIMAMVGMQLMYVGLLAAIPIGLTTIASVFEERFPADDGAGKDRLPSNA